MSRLGGENPGSLLLLADCDGLLPDGRESQRGGEYLERDREGETMIPAEASGAPA